MVSRRSSLIGMAAVLAACMGAVGVGDVAVRAEIAAAVRKRLRFLHLDESGLDAFAKDQLAVLLAKRPSWVRIRYHFDALFMPPAATRFGYSSDTRSRLERLEDYLATVYLLSSDFFKNDADESRVVRYVALYDPVRACGNPFARPAPGASVATRT